MIGRIPIRDVQPVVDCGQRPAKAVAGEIFPVSATVFREGHGMLGAAVILTDPAGSSRPPFMMHLLSPGTDRWGAEVAPDTEGQWQFHVEAWGDPIAAWQHDAAIKIPIGQDTELVLAAGAQLFARAARQLEKAVRKAEKAGKVLAGQRRSGSAEPSRAETGKAGSDGLRALLAADGAPEQARKATALLASMAARLAASDEPPEMLLASTLNGELAEVLERFPLREFVTRSARFPLVVHRERALYGSWYEFFPRSEGATVDPAGQRPPVSGTLRTAARRLDDVAAMGFDVIYLPPVHPIGSTARKGKNNTLTAGPDDPGSPWAIGSPDGGHDAIHPGLGTFGDFDAFVARAGELGLEVAIDLALQCSPDHPWVTEHPEWFAKRADGSIAYAENPPKKYQDIYPLSFDEDPDGLYAEVLRIVRLWISHGVTIFRVDNPHTKPLPFWERLLGEIAASDPGVLFLAEAFTRPAMMHALAAIGFHQSYTYFTWRNSSGELRGYLTELAADAAAYMRPNFFVNTPDILHQYLQEGGPPAFRVRAALAALLSPSWGVYAGYELCENVPVRPGSEEYLDSEKYQLKPRDWEFAKRHDLGIAPFIAALNDIRRRHPALHQLRNLRFHYPDQPEFLCFSKSTGAAGPGTPGGDTVLVVVNLDPHQPREATVWIDGAALGVDVSSGFTVTDELTGASYLWGGANYVRLDPAAAPAHIFTLTAGQPAAGTGHA